MRYEVICPSGLVALLVAEDIAALHPSCCQCSGRYVCFLSCWTSDRQEHSAVTISRHIFFMMPRKTTRRAVLRVVVDYSADLALSALNYILVLQNGIKSSYCRRCKQRIMIPHHHPLWFLAPGAEQA